MKFEIVFLSQLLSLKYNQLKILLMKQCVLFILFILFNNFAFSQTYTYKYFLNNELTSVDSASALFIGKGLKEDSLFLLDGFIKSTGKLFMSAHFTDSSLNTLQGEYKSFHNNGENEQTGYYANGEEQGWWVTTDTAGNIIDSSEYNKGKKSSSRMYQYHPNGKIRTYSRQHSDALQSVYLMYDTSGNIIPENLDDKIFTKTEVESIYPGGLEAWSVFLRKNLKMPDLEKYSVSTGIYTVIVRFIINKNGTVSDIVPETSNGYGMETEVIRLINLSKNWIPARQNGFTVRSYKRQPVTFYIDNGDKKN